MEESVCKIHVTLVPRASSIDETSKFAKHLPHCACTSSKFLRNRASYTHCAVRGVTNCTDACLSPNRVHQSPFLLVLARRIWESLRYVKASCRRERKRVGVPIAKHILVKLRMLRCCRQCFPNIIYDTITTNDYGTDERNEHRQSSGNSLNGDWGRDQSPIG